MTKSRNRTPIRTDGQKGTDRWFSAPHPREAASRASPTGRMGDRKRATTASIRVMARLTRQRAAFGVVSGRRGAAISATATAMKISKKKPTRIAASWGKIVHPNPMPSPISGPAEGLKGE